MVSTPRQISATTPALALPPLERQPRGGTVPVSYNQQRLWLLRRLRLVKTVGDESPAKLQLSGKLDVGALGRALEEIIARHDILRTCFQVIEGAAFQIIDTAGRIRPRIIDLSDLHASARQAATSRLLEEEAQCHFDLSRGPLFRATLIRSSEEEHLLLFKIHHMVFDGWSWNVLLHELGVLYAAFAAGADRAPLPELPVQYADYSLWQRGWLRGEVLRRELRYWKKRLHGLQALRLPTDRPRPRAPSFKGARLPCEFPRELVSDLRSFARRERATFYMVILTALQVLLARWSGQTDIAVGSLVAGRIHRKTEALIGFFLNIVTIRTDLSEALSFCGVLAQVRKSVLEAHDHQHVSFERVLQALGLDPQPAQHPVFQVMFVLQNTPAVTLDLPGVSARFSHGVRLTARYDLTLELREADNGVSGHLDYATDLFDGATVERFCRQLRALLEAIVKNSHAPIPTFVDDIV